MKKMVTKKTDYVSPELKTVCLSGESAITTSVEPNSKGWDNGTTLGGFEDYVGGAF